MKTPRNISAREIYYRKRSAAWVGQGKFSKGNVICITPQSGGTEEFIEQEKVEGNSSGQESSVCKTHRTMYMMLNLDAQSLTGAGKKLFKSGCCV